MGTTLIQNAPGEIVTYIETLGGTPALDLTSQTAVVDIKKSNAATFVNSPRVTTVNASQTIGSGPNGTVTVEVPGSVGNTYTIAVVAPISGTSPLEIDVTGTAITVTLAISAGTLVAAANTANLVASAIDSLVANATATASGTGADSLTISESATALVGGSDGTFTDIGDGFYRISFEDTDLDVLGAFVVRVTGPQLRPSLESAYITASVVQTPPATINLSVTTITGSIFDATGAPRVGVAVQARTLSSPSIIAGVAVTTNLITVKTDSVGQFTLSLLAGAQVDISIPAVNYRRTITVPSTSANLFQIP